MFRKDSDQCLSYKSIHDVDNIIIIYSINKILIKINVKKWDYSIEIKIIIMIMNL